MKNETGYLARKITRASSKQSYYTASFLVDHDLVEDCCRAYAYFRWADDVIDGNSNARADRIAFIDRQISLIDQLYQGKDLQGLCREEEILADLIRRNREENTGLYSFITNFMAVLEFDAYRRGNYINQHELDWYSSCLGKAVTDAIQYFVRNGYSYPDGPNRYLAAKAAHMTHMLRDLVSDLEDGYINIPRKYIKAHGIKLNDIQSPAMRAWVQEQVLLARQYFQAGKEYLDELEVLRCKIAGYWYCARFECVLDSIEKDGYVLRENYNERYKFSTRFRLIKLAISLIISHVYRNVFGTSASHQMTGKALGDQT